MHLKSLAGLSLITLALLPDAVIAAPTFSPFVTSGDINSALGNNQTIGFSYAGNKFVGSVYFGANNNQLYSTDLNGGNVQKFGAPLPGMSGEVYVSSSLGLGGYGPRDVFAGSQASGDVYRVANDGSSQSLFASGLVGAVRSIAFDPYGNYGNSMIVATSAGNVYKVSNAGVPTLLANVGEDAEGLSFAPQSFGGRPAGTLFIASEGSGVLRSILPNGTASVAVNGLPGAEMVSFVPTNLGLSGNPVEGFYAAAFPTDIQKSPASDFLPYIGQAIVTSETGHQVWAIDGSLNVTQIATFPGQPEDGIFVTADLIHPRVPDSGSTLSLLSVGLGAVAFLVRRTKA